MVYGHTIKSRFCLRKLRIGINKKKNNTSKKIIFFSILQAAIGGTERLNDLPQPEQGGGCPDLEFLSYAFALRLSKSYL